MVSIKGHNEGKSSDLGASGGYYKEAEKMFLWKNRGPISNRCYGIFLETKDMAFN